jgi:hypothetical protein
MNPSIMNEITTVGLDLAKIRPQIKYVWDVGVL